MKIRTEQILLTFCALLTALAVSAQELPLLPSDPAVSQGILPNGAAYYIVANASTKAMADFALVQKTGTRTDSLDAGGAVRTAKDALSRLPRLKDSSPQEFLTSRGVTPGKDGFVKVSENATVFLFDNVMLSRNATVLDSTLLVLLDIMDRANSTEDEYLKKWYSPADQAIIVAGDVDPKSVSEKLKHMSLMIPARSSLPREQYSWKDIDSARFVTSRDSVRNIAVISATWRSARTPREYMNTVQPAIYDMFVNELGAMAVARIRERLRSEGIPVADVSYDHIDSVESLADEHFTIKVSVAPEHSASAAAALASAMASLDAGNAARKEFREARRGYLDAMTMEDRRPLRRNSDYVDRCVSAFLYNATLASQKEKLAFHTSRDLADTTELRLFDGIASALLDSSKNLTIGYVMGRFQNEMTDVKAVFDSTWRADNVPLPEPAVDTVKVPLLPGHGPKVKLRMAKTEPMSGGQMWTFSNGFRVIYRKMPAYDNIYYSLVLNGGYSSVRDLGDGEGAYMSDYLGLCRVGGLDGLEFRHFLGAEGITMKSEVELSGTKISGYVPEDKAELMIRLLLAVMNGREHDEEAFDYYVRTENLRHEYVKGSVEERVAAIDSIMCPDYIYSSRKASGKLSDALGKKADDFYRRLAGKTNDGVLVLVGDVDEVMLKKMLMTYVGGFVTTDRAFARPSVRYQPVSGWSTYTIEGDVNSVDIAMSSPLTLSADNRMAAMVAAMILKHSLSEAIVGTGMYLSLSYDFGVYPQERFNVMISLNEAYKDGFSSDTVLSGSITALEVLREALSDLAQTPVSRSGLESCKAMLKERLALEMNDPQYWIKAIADRFINGKDFTTGYKERIDAVTVDKVKAILTSLNEGCKIEYTIRKK